MWSPIRVKPLKSLSSRLAGKSMIIESIELKNYRNYKELHMEFNQGTNILYGDNAQGKTNILEAVYVCCTSKSHKSAKDRDIIRFNQDESHIKLQIRKNNVPYRIDMHLKRTSQRALPSMGFPYARPVSCSA